MSFMLSGVGKLNDRQRQSHVDQSVMALLGRPKCHKTSSSVESHDLDTISSSILHLLAMDFLKNAAQQYTQSQSHDNQGQNNNQGQGHQNQNNDLGGMMGALSNALGSQNKDSNQQHGQGSQPNAQLGGLMNMVNGALGGGAKGEAKEDKLDKAVDMFQEHVLKAGSQSNESAIEQAKDKQIADAIRSGYKQFTGKDIPS